MSETLWGWSAVGEEPRRGRIRGFLAGLGRAVRRPASYVLLIASLSFGVVYEACRPGIWRRTVRAEFRRALRHAIGGGLATNVVTAILIGLAMVYQALYWLGEAGEQDLVGVVLVTILVREIAPVLVGLILLGRSGMVALSEIGAMQTGGQVHAIEAQGLDAFRLLVLPRACAFAIAAFTLGVVFVLTALVTGFVAVSLLRSTQTSLWSFLDRVLLAMRDIDFAVFPVKLVVIGLLVALTACATGITARPGTAAASLLPRGFVRGVLAILLSSALLSLAT